MAGRLQVHRHRRVRLPCLQIFSQPHFRQQRACPSPGRPLGAGFTLPGSTLAAGSNTQPSTLPAGGSTTQPSNQPPSTPSQPTVLHAGQPNGAGTLTAAAGGAASHVASGVVTGPQAASSCVLAQQGQVASLPAQHHSVLPCASQRHTSQCSRDASASQPGIASRGAHPQYAAKLQCSCQQWRPQWPNAGSRLPSNFPCSEAGCSHEPHWAASWACGWESW